MVLYYLTVNVNIFFSLYCIPPLIDTDKALASIKAMSQRWWHIKSKAPSKAESVMGKTDEAVMDEPDAKSRTKSYDHTQSVNDVYAIAKFARDILSDVRIEPPNTILYVEAAISSLYECDEDYAARDRDNALLPSSGIPLLLEFFHEYPSPYTQEATACLARLNDALDYTLSAYRRRILIPNFADPTNHENSVIFSLPEEQLKLFRANWNRHSNPFIENWYKFPRDLSRSNRRSTRPKPMKRSSKPSKGIGGKKRKRANHTQRRTRHKKRTQ